MRMFKTLRKKIAYFFVKKELYLRKIFLQIIIRITKEYNTNKRTKNFQTQIINLNTFPSKSKHRIVSNII